MSKSCHSTACAWHICTAARPLACCWLLVLQCGTVAMFLTESRLATCLLQGWVICFAFAQFIFGCGIGGECELQLCVCIALCWHFCLLQFPAHDLGSLRLWLSCIIITTCKVARSTQPLRQSVQQLPVCPACRPHDLHSCNRGE